LLALDPWRNNPLAPNDLLITCILTRASSLPLEANLRLTNFVPHDHLLLDRSLNSGPLISRWELDKFKNC
jgi:hypothetical protein